MKFTFKNFGNIDSGKIELADLTLICGPNNVGKTYISYAIYGFIKKFINLINIDIKQEWVEDLSNKGILKIKTQDFLEDISLQSKSSGLNFMMVINRFFNSPSDFFQDSKIDLFFDISNINSSFLFKGEAYYDSEFLVKIEKKKNSKYIYIVLDTLYFDFDIEIRWDIIIHDLLKKLVMNSISNNFSNPFIVTSERTSISLFYKELDKNRNELFESILDVYRLSSDSSFENSYSRYAEPIRDNINTIRDYENINKHKSFLSKDKEKYHAIFDLLQEIMGGSFENKSNQVLYRPKKEKGRDEILIPIYLSSSSTKSLFLIDLYINCIAQENGLLVIDEPELNLHPDNQRKMASLLARLVNSGIKVLITTHSDYLIREINNRIMLSNDINNKEKIMNDNGLLNEDILKPKQVAAYTLDTEHKINKVKVDKFGMNMEIFDDIIAQVNDIGDDIYYNIKD